MLIARGEAGRTTAAEVGQVALPNLVVAASNGCGQTKLTLRGGHHTAQCVVLATRRQVILSAAARDDAGKSTRTGASGRVMGIVH